MQKTIRSFLLLMVITGMIFSGCSYLRQDDQDAVIEENSQDMENTESMDSEDQSGKIVKPTTVSIVIGEGDEENAEIIDVEGDNEIEVSAVIPDETEIKNVTEADDVPKYVSGGVTKVGHYQSPAGPEEIEIRLEIEDGVIAAALAVPMTEHETSKIYQGKFAEGFADAVVGKSLDEVSLSVVNGSSLSPKAFNEVLEGVKKEFLN